MPVIMNEAERPNENAENCNWCEVEFGLFERQKHCSFCSRSVCKACSVELEVPKDARLCDYCALKNDNP